MPLMHDSSCIAQLCIAQGPRYYIVKGIALAEQPFVNTGDGPDDRYPSCMIALRQVPGCTRTMRAPSCELWRTLANFGEPITLYAEQPPEFRRRSPTFTKVPLKVRSVCGWSSECAGFACMAQAPHHCIAKGIAVVALVL